MLLTAFWRLLLNFMWVVFILPSKQHFKQSTLHFAPSTYISTTGREASRLPKKSLLGCPPQRRVANWRRTRRHIRGRWRKGKRQRTRGVWELSARASQEQEKGQGQGGEAESKGPRTQASPGCSPPSFPVPQVWTAITSVTNQVCKFVKFADYKMCISKILREK